MLACGKLVCTFRCVALVAWSPPGVNGYKHLAVIWGNVL